MNYPSLFLCAVLASGCGAKSIDLGGAGDQPSTTGTGGSDAATSVKLVDPGAEVFMASQDSAIALVVDSERVYWYSSMPFGGPFDGAHSAQVRGCNKNACPQSTVTYSSFPAERGGSTTPFLAIATSGTDLYWAEQTTPSASGSSSGKVVIRRCPVAGCTGAPTDVVQISDGISYGISSMTLDDAFVYWTSPMDTAVLRCPVTGCNTPQAVALNQLSPGAVTVDATHVYWIAGSLGADSRILRAAKDGSDAKATVVADAQNQAASLAIDAGAVYWSNRYSVGNVSRCPLTGCVGAPTVLASGQAFPWNIVADGASVYWVSGSLGLVGPYGGGTGAVFGCSSVDSCGPNPHALATGLDFVGWGFYQTIALDATHVYWVAQGIKEPLGAFPNATIYRARR